MTATTLTDLHLRPLLRDLCSLQPRFLAISWDIRSAVHALGLSMIYDGIDCRMPSGREFACVLAGKVRCAEIINARARAGLPVLP